MALNRFVNQQLSRLILNRKLNCKISNQLISRLNQLNEDKSTNNQLKKFTKFRAPANLPHQLDSNKMSSTESDQELTNEQIAELFSKKPVNLLIRKYDDQDIIFFKLQFKYKSNNKGKLKIKEKFFSFKRNLNEPLKSFIDRMKLNVAQFVLTSKSKSKKKSSESIEEDKISSQNLLDVNLKYKNQDLINQNFQIADLFKLDTNELEFKINDQDYKIYLNPQFISSCKLPKIILDGFEVFPFVQIDFRNELEPFYGWFKKLDMRHQDYWQLKKDGKLSKSLLQLSDQLTYTPTKEDLGCELIFKITSRLTEDQTLETYEVTSKRVTQSPDYLPYTKRHKLTNHTIENANEFRIVTYNLLADMYSDSKTAREELFSYCPKQFLTMDYRKHLLIDELLGYNADLICLQEVDFSIFEKHLEPAFKLKTNLAGSIALKNEMQEGSAIFYNQSKFKLIDKLELRLGDLIKKDCFKELADQIKANFVLNTRFSVRPQKLQMNALECTQSADSRILLVFNTHFYFHPDSDHIRLLHACLIAKEIEDQIESYSKCYKHVIPLLAGDFNSCPEFGVYKLFTQSKIDKDLDDWRSCKLLF